jgi:hypothetical protein
MLPDATVTCYVLHSAAGAARGSLSESCNDHATTALALYLHGFPSLSRLPVKYGVGGNRTRVHGTIHLASTSVGVTRHGIRSSLFLLSGAAICPPPLSQIWTETWTAFLLIGLGSDRYTLCP